jgi:hypothetical protein
VPAEVTFDFDALRRISMQACEQVVRSTLVAYITEVKRLMREHKTGRVYIRAGGRVHRASAPGEAPAVDFKNLIQAIGIEMQETPTGWIGIAGVQESAGLSPSGQSPLDYALMLEFGTSKMAPRPVWRVAIPAAIFFAENRLKESAIKVNVSGEFQDAEGAVESVVEILGFA